MKVFKIMLLLSLLSPAVYAKEMGGVEFDELVRVMGLHNQLKLNGVGIRHKFFFKIYVAGLYVEKKSEYAEAIIEHKGANRVRMHFVYDEVPLEKLVNGWLEGFEDNISEDEFKALKPRIDKFNALFETMHKGDEVLLDYIPKEGTRVTIKGKVRGIIKGHDFNQALLKIWLGEEPVTEDLKEALLGI